MQVLTQVIVLLFLLIFQAIIKYTSDLSLISLNYKIYLNDANLILEKYVTNDLNKIRNYPIENITSNIRYDSGSIVSVLRDYIIIFGALLMLTMYLIFSLYISINMTLFTLLIISIPFLINKKLYLKLKEAGKLKVASNERVIGFFNDFLSGIHRIKIDFLENKFIELSKPVLFKSQVWRILKRKTISKIEIVTSTIMLGFILTILFLGITVFSLELPALMILLVIFSQMRVSTNIISLHYGRIKELEPNVARFFQLFDNFQTGSSVVIHSNDINVFAPKQVIVDKINFAYDEKKIINNLSFSANAGDRILIQGPSGHGKSTFVELLCGLMFPDSGSIKYDDVIMDSELFKISRKKTIIVSPDIYLFNLSIRENLLMGKSVNNNTLDKAISNSFLNEVIADLPKGLDNKIGVNGNALSLGQRQRLILARLFLRKPKLIILDEPTANIDPKLETEIFNNVYSYIDSDAILITIAHKKPSKISFNKYYEIYNGKMLQH